MISTHRSAFHIEGCMAGPLSGFFTITDVVILDPRHDLIEVIVLLSRAQLRKTQHGEQLLRNLLSGLIFSATHSRG